jgi:hypothetical protein
MENNADNPNLSVRIANFKAITGSDFTRINLKGSSLNIVHAVLP